MKLEREKVEYKASWMSHFNLGDEYERTARLLPALITLMAFLPGAISLFGYRAEWIAALAASGGAGVIIAIFLSHIASAAGNRMQSLLWPRWPFDSPTNLWLSPENKGASAKQRALWYERIYRLTGLDIGQAVKDENSDLEALINDAIRELRYRLRDRAKWLRKHNTEYGFARNLLGLRAAWSVIGIGSCVVCWWSHLQEGSNLMWCVASSVILLLLPLIGWIILPAYVRRAADRYAESFFGALAELDHESS